MGKGTFKTLETDFDTALAKLPEALAAEGFGIVTQMDLQAIFAAKLGVEHPRYRIFGACNPKLAHGAVTANPEIGVLLPCNVVLYERADGKAVLGAIDPLESLGASGDASFEALADEVGKKLERVLGAIA